MTLHEWGGTGLPAAVLHDDRRRDEITRILTTAADVFRLGGVNRLLAAQPKGNGSKRAWHVKRARYATALVLHETTLLTHADISRIMNGFVRRRRQADRPRARGDGGEHSWSQVTCHKQRRNADTLRYRRVLLAALDGSGAYRAADDRCILCGARQ